MEALPNLYFDIDDPGKPHFLVSSSVDDIVLELVARYNDHRRWNNNWQGPLIGTNDQISISIELELNSLLLRCPHLKPSDLMKHNLVCSVNTNRPVNKLVYLGDFPVPVSNQMFVLSMRLEVVDFHIKQDKVFIQFRDTSMYKILAQSEDRLIDQIENYVIAKFRSNTDRGKLMTKSSRKFNPVPISAGTNDISDSTLDESAVDHSFSDSETSSVDEFELRLTDSTNTMRDECEQIGKLASGKFTEEFIQNEDNLRHNEVHVDLSNIEEVDCNLEDDNFEVIDTSPQQEHYQYEQLLHIDPVVLNDLTSESESVLKYPNPVLFHSPSKKVTKKSSSMSLSMINDDDLIDLKYAMNDTDVPSYIKENKKFKFIKVGKVQKFVHLFEEKSEHSSRSTSPTRIKSPVS
jgi:hypothetical protein